MPEKGWRADALFGAIATAFGAASLAYPFGRDQGCFYYVAREWLERGQVVYRDVWDHKPPVIYWIHMATIALFGEHAWGIRLVELAVAVPLTAWVASRLARPSGKPYVPGTFGAAWLGASIVQYGYLSFWDSAQTEIWYALFAVGGLAAVLRARRETAGFLAGGALSALALFTKPSAICFVLLSVGSLVVRVRRRGGKPSEVARALGAFTAAGAAVSAAIILPMVALHAFRPMIEVLVRVNSHYLAHEMARIDGWGVLAQAGAVMQPFSSALVVIVALTAYAGRARNEPELARRYALPVLLAFASFGAVLVQIKFYYYHWSTLVAAAALFFALLWGDSVRVAGKGRSFKPVLAFLAFVAGLYAFSGNNAERWYDAYRDTIRYETGAIDELTYAKRFDIPFFSNSDALRVGNWLRQHSRPEDVVVVRGFEPEVYAISGRHYTGRFFWTNFLTAPRRRYRREQWLAEDRAALEAHPPKFAVAINVVSEGVDSPQWFERLGYVRRVEFGAFTILERTDPG
jgi:4-amino-4-deoxy-L-arabinose transferase-like glycosyltransferase